MNEEAETKIREHVKNVFVPGKDQESTVKIGGGEIWNSTCDLALY